MFINDDSFKIQTYLSVHLCVWMSISPSIHPVQVLNRLQCMNAVKRNIKAIQPTIRVQPDTRTLKEFKVQLQHKLHDTTVEHER